ncbi:MAG TPA: hypothetical protein VGK14_01195 [Novimethylophilus sp.]|jgi:hypothetical protein|uniref:hypothetical protein n=1 Tax=Novimethylophilus sp. TaxID=2137426 RepID=UPI002F3F2D1B
MEWLANNLADNPLAAQELALRQLHELSLQGHERLLWLIETDTTLNASARLLAKRYAEARRLPAEQEAHLWNTGHAYHDQWARAYSQSLREISQDARSAAEAPAIVARILYHCGRTAVWRNFRYIADPNGWWLDIHKLYAFAERDNFATRPIPLYQTEPAVSCTMLYLHNLLLDSINRTNLTKHQIETIYQWLHQWSGKLELERDYREERQLFYVNLSEDRGSRRIRNLEPTDSCRYWQTDLMVADIEQAMENAETGRHAEGEIELDILQQMHAEWSRSAYRRQRRTDERDTVTKQASVANGIYAVCQEVQSQAVGGVSMELGGELWCIENESRYGFGAIVSTELNTWLKVGRLIALREEMNLGMSMVGVVRSLKHQEEGKVYVGVEVLSHMALYGTLQEMHDGPGNQPFPGVFISSDEERGIPSSLLLPAIEYQADAQLRLRLDRRVRHVWLSRLMERKDDWVRVEVEVLGNAA